MVNIIKHNATPMTKAAAEDVLSTGSGKQKRTRSAASIDSIVASMGRNFYSLDAGSCKYIKTGLTLFDWQLSGGKGLPSGCILHAYSGEGAGKSHLLYQLAAQAAQQTHGATVFDQEGSLMGLEGRAYLTRLGLPADVRVYTALDQNQVFAYISEICRYMIDNDLTHEGYLIGIDSVASMSPDLFDEDKEKEFGKTVVGEQARAFSDALRYLSSVVRVAGVTVVFLNQLRSKVQTGFAAMKSAGPKDAPTGGKALPYYAHVNLMLKAGEFLYKKSADKSDREHLDSSALGRVVTLYTEKNKLFAPFRRVSMPFFFGCGYDNVFSLVNMASTEGLIPLSKGRVTWHDKSYRIRELWMHFQDPEYQSDFLDFEAMCISFLDSIGYTDATGNPLKDSVCQALAAIGDGENNLEVEPGSSFGVPASEDTEADPNGDDFGED